MMRNHQPVLAYIAGKPAGFTGKDHNFFAGEAVEKQLVVINNGRHETSFECDWRFSVPGSNAGQRSVSIKPGEQARLPIRYDLPANLAPGTHDLAATVRF